MPRPPMIQEITAYLPVINEQGKIEKDKRGNPITNPLVTEASVIFSSQVIKGTNGQEYKVLLEVELPPNVPVIYGMEIEYKPPNQSAIKGIVVAMEEDTNLTGTIVNFRTVFIG